MKTLINDDFNKFQWSVSRFRIFNECVRTYYDQYYGRRNREGVSPVRQVANTCRWAASRLCVA